MFLSEVLTFFLVYIIVICVKCFFGFLDFFDVFPCFSQGLLVGFYRFLAIRKAFYIGINRNLIFV